MKVDNSGPAFVFDAKTTEAIEEGKNKVTLLQVEELRLTKLKKSLEAELIKLEAAIADKNKILDVLVSYIDEYNHLLLITGEKVEKAEATAAQVNKELDERVATVQGQETQVREKITALNEREKALNEREQAVKDMQVTATATLTAAEDKKNKIDTFLKSL